MINALFRQKSRDFIGITKTLKAMVIGLLSQYKRRFENEAILKKVINLIKGLRGESQSKNQNISKGQLIEL